MYVGIDQSYSGFGVTWIDSFGYHVTEVGKFDPKRYGTGVVRLQVMAQWLRDLLGIIDLTEDVEHVCMEGYANGAKFGREQAGELGGMVKHVLYEYGFAKTDVRYPTIVPPSSLKKYVLGAGKGGKNEMLLGVYKQWGVEFKDDNAADSYGLARLAQDIHSDSAKYQYQKDVISALRIHTEKR